MSGPLDMGDELVENVADPVSAQDAATRAWVLAQVGAAAALPTGFLGHHAGASPPTGWLVCDGSTLLIADYAALFAVCGTTYGGNGTTNFKLPDRLGRFDLGSGAGSGLTSRTLGAAGGEEAHVLIVSEMPAHHHSYTGLGGSPSSTGFGNSGGTQQTGDTGGGGAHNTMPPFLATLPIIKA